MSFEWQSSTPEAEGLDSRILNQLDDYIKQKRYRLVNSVLVVKNGKLVFERYYNRFNDQSRNSIKSIWKSILAILTGICLDQGLIRSLDEPIGNYIPQFTQNNHPYHKLITIRHLLTMTSGIYWNGGVHYHCPMLVQMMRTGDWTSHLADIEMADVPGTKFEYKEWDVMLLSAVLGRACGGTAYDLAKQYVYGPLNIVSGEWPQSPCGFSYTVMKGEECSNLSARDLAKLGLLFMGEGVFDGRRIVSADFVRQTISLSQEDGPIAGRPSDSPVPPDPSPGRSSAYGYLWWLFPEGYGCRGYGGQEVNVLPEHQFISVIQATPTRSSKSYGDIQRNILRESLG